MAGEESDGESHALLQADCQAHAPPTQKFPSCECPSSRARALVEGLITADLLFLRPWDKPLRSPRDATVSLGGAFPEVLVLADVDVSGETVGARPEAQALGLRWMR